MLTVSELIGSTDPELVAGKKVEELVMIGVGRELAMQTPSGGFGYWAGDPDPNPWATAFATHFLLDAQRAGYPIPQERIDAALTWMANQVESGANVNNASGNYHGFTGGSTEAYMHLVLAMAGKARKARIQSLIDGMPGSLHGRDGETAYMLKSALYLAGDHRYEKDLKSFDLSQVSEERTNDWTFYSDRRSRGFMLTMAQDLFGNDDKLDGLAQLVADSLKGDVSEHYTTQELLWGVNGLGKRVKGFARDFKPGVILADGKTLLPQPVPHSARSCDRTWTLHRASERKSLELKVEDPGKGKLYLVMTSDGVKAKTKYESGGNGLSVGRSFHRLDGSTFDPAADPMSLAEMVYVEDTIENRSGSRVQNIALVDRLPAGWEIENPRLGRGNDLDWVSAEGLWKADYMSLRDDRIELFGALEAGEKKTVVYAARAVTSGKFTIPPIEAEAMYDPRIWAREVGEVIRIEGPWKDFLL